MYTYASVHTIKVRWSTHTLHDGGTKRGIAQYTSYTTSPRSLRTVTNQRTLRRGGSVEQREISTPIFLYIYYIYVHNIIHSAIYNNNMYIGIWAMPPCDIA